VIVKVDADSPVPPYEQIRAQVATMITSGVLPTGTRLPTIRQLAGDLTLAGGTVARAYRELEQQGFVRSRGRHGTFVERIPPKSAPTRADLEAAAHSYAVTALQLGANTRDALAAVERAFTTIPAQ